MNKLIKIAPIIVILAAAGSLFFTFKLGTLKKQLLDQNQQLTSDKARIEKDLSGAKQDLASAKKNLAQTKADLATATNSLEETKTALDQKTQEATGLKAQLDERGQQLQTAKKELANVQGELQKIKEGLFAVGFTNIENVAQIRERVQATLEENKVLNDGLAKMRDENQQLKDKIVELSTTPVNTRGRVAEVQDRWNFLVLDIGEQQQVRKHSEFLIYRDSKPVSRVQVLWVGPTVSVAEIMPGYRNGTPRVGDVAVH